MKNKYLLIILIFAAGFILNACGREKPAEETAIFAGSENLSRDTSYAFGMLYGMEILNMMLSNYMIPYVDEFMLGLNDIMKGRETRYSIEEAYQKIDSELNLLYGSYSDEEIESFRQEEIDLLIENAKRPEVRITPSGLQYQVVTEGTGPKPGVNAVVLVDYEGTLIDGSVFDSSYNRGYPLEIGVNEVIDGWTEGLQLMSVGSQYIFYIPSELAYGPIGTGSIPPYATLIFIIELHDIIN